MPVEFYLRDVTETDLPKRVEWINSDACERMNIARPVTLKEAQEWFARNHGSNKKKHFTIVDKENDRLIGIFGFTDIDEMHKNANCYLVIGEKEYLGKKISLRVFQWAFRKFFEEMQYNRIYGIIDEDNIPCLKMVESLGFVREGYLRQQAFRNGNFINRYLYAMLKEDWEKQN